MTTPAAPAVVVREATSADLPQIARLLSTRDEQSRDVRVVRDYLWQLDPEHVRGWIAVVDGEPAGYSMFYLRTMRWPTTEDISAEIRAGYWAHLFVDPRFRKLMVYPQLVLAMFRGMKAAGVSALLTAMRRPTVMEAHLRLGFRLVGELPVKLRLLRPWRLLAKHKGHAWLAPLCWPLDFLYGVASKRRFRRRDVEQVDLHSPHIEQVVSLLNSAPAGSIRQLWTVDQFRRRYRVALDGAKYRITAVRRGEQLEAVLVMVIAERGNRVRAGVLLELAAGTDAHSAAILSLLSDAEQFARAHGAETMLSLAESLNRPQLAGGADKYFVTRAEKYQMIVYPAAMVADPYSVANIDNWTFQFGDHDAF